MLEIIWLYDHSLLYEAISYWFRYCSYWLSEIFIFLPVTYQTDIRTVKFIQKFQSSDNHICNLFSKKAEIGVKNIFSQYGSQIHNVYGLKNFFENIFFGDDP